MKIGIDASRAFLRRRTGIEEYSYQIIRHLRDELREDEVVLYVRKKIGFRDGRVQFFSPDIDFELPAHWRVKGLWAPRFWTQVRLSLEMLFAAPEALFVPAHTVPIIHPKRTIVTIHGLEYEFSPESYGLLERVYMRWSIRHSVRTAWHVITVSENTKRDVIRFYGTSEKKMSVIYEGVSIGNPASSIQHPELISQFSITDSKYMLFIGRLETRKNIIRIIEAFEKFKNATGLSHQLVLAGKPGYGYGNIRAKIQGSRFKSEIREVGYVTEEEKWQLLKNAEMFLFPSLYEGFGLPVIEAQNMGIPVITSNVSSLPEISGEGVLLIDPLSPEDLAQAMEQLVKNLQKRADIIEIAFQNAGRFSWERCARELKAQLVN
ncbi:MAG: glycosyltransferase family 1 protein [Candidatus Moraniibacteriota bacterium]